MSINISSKKLSSAGICLEQPFDSEEHLLVFTGKNGCGKSRVFNAIAEMACEVSIGGEVIGKDSIRKLESADLVPKFINGTNESSKQEIDAAYAFVKRCVKSPQLVATLPKQVGARYKNGMDQPKFSVEALISVTVSSKKSIPELTLQDLELYYSLSISMENLFGTQDISSLCNGYLRRKQRNEFRQFLKKEKGRDVPCESDKDFDAANERPWIKLNRIIGDVFSGKFRFSEPDENSDEFDYKASLLERDDPRPDVVSSLSGGEKTLMWLAITMFNTQFYRKKGAISPKLLLIDEPDAFLHPQMVKQMFKVFDSFIKEFDVTVIMISHSPTTVALAPLNSICRVSASSIKKITQDEAITDLLDGITSVSINPNNRRQVFVESQSDADIYELLYSALKKHSNELDPGISMSFISSGRKVSVKNITKHIKAVFVKATEEQISDVISKVNGEGSDNQVIAQVEALKTHQHETTRGIIDWDDREPEVYHNVSVLGEGLARTIENITLDPICILEILIRNHPSLYLIKEICGEDVELDDWLCRDDLLQNSVDWFIQSILKRPNNKDLILEYITPIHSDRSRPAPQALVLKSDKGYLHLKGHDSKPDEIDLLKLVVHEHSKLKKCALYGQDKKVPYSVVELSMSKLKKGRFIPKAFEDLFLEIQK